MLGHSTFAYLCGLLAVASSDRTLTALVELMDTVVSVMLVVTIMMTMGLWRKLKACWEHCREPVRSSTSELLLQGTRAADAERDPAHPDSLLTAANIKISDTCTAMEIEMFPSAADHDQDPDIAAVFDPAADGRASTYQAPSIPIQMPLLTRHHTFEH